MRLKRVEMIGFKSFMDRTVLDFRDGITTVLGPNGCGKSNVVDAVRWVLGEQSAKQLRGEKMEDVIFKGTRKRKPLSVAEVSLVFDNSSQQLNMPHNEVAITRRVSRSGTSDYFLNKTPCRLKDIKDLFYDTGVGNNAYSVIEQEVVGQVLDPNENKVRTILEEGSGIVRYKVKRKEALRKLDLTERDLLRVEDIIEEIGKQVRSLARQVGKARRHQRLFGEVRGLELIRAHLRLRDLRVELEELKKRDEELRSEGTGDDAEAARLNAAIASMKPELDRLEDDRRTRAQSLSEVEGVLNRIEGELLVLREKIDAGGRRREEIGEELERGRTRAEEVAGEQAQADEERGALSSALGEHEAVVARLDEAARDIIARHEEARQSLAAAQQLSLGFIREEANQKRDITAAETRLESLRQEEERVRLMTAESEQRLQALREELARLQAEGEEKGRERAELEAELTRAEEEVVTAEQALQDARTAREAAADELARLESRHDIAARIAEEFEGYRAGAAALLKNPETQGRVKGAMAERLQVREGYEAAFELLFGEDADALLVGDVRDARSLADRLAHDDLGLASFLADTGHAQRQDELSFQMPGRPATEFVRVDDEIHAVIHRWLARVRVVETNDEAVDALLAHAGEGFSFLSRQGLYLRADGLVRGGAGARRQLSIFGRRDQLEHLASEVEKHRGVLRERQAEQDRRKEALTQAQQRVQERRAALETAKQQSGELAQLHASRRSVLEREQEQRERTQQQQERVEGDIRQLLDTVEGLRDHLGRHGADQEASERRVQELAAQVEALEAQREQAQSELGEARLQLAHDRGNERELQSRLERMSHMRNELVERIGRLEEEGTTLESNLGEWKSTVEQRGAELAELYLDREKRQEELRGAQEAIETRRADLEGLQDQLREVTQRQRAKSDAMHEVETRMTKLQFTEQNVADRIQEKFHVGVDEGFASIDVEALPKDLVHEDDTYQLAQVEEFLAERNEKLEKLGPVNFVALDEYEEKKTRLEFLEKQRDDLLQSKEDLLQAIDKINRTARQLFHETFEQVRANFREIFSTLFEGGEADLILHKTDDPLEADIQVMARPSGKRIDSVSLLSGGERALTAISLLFAVYLIKPSPFCLLDEVDAPLDDMNVGRFVRLLERFADRTQFIVITHNKLTMEAADHLYGVTMAESGVSRLVSVTFEELDTEDPIAALEGVAAERRDAKAHPERRLQSRGGESSNGGGDTLLAEAAAAGDADASADGED